MACWVIAVRGTVNYRVVEELEKVYNAIREKYGHCFRMRKLFGRYLIVCDTEDRCYDSEGLLKEFIAPPCIVLLTPERFLEEIVW